MLIDLHTHTECSFDCEIPFSVMCDSAAEKGVNILASTDHCDLTQDSEENEVMSSVLLSLKNAQALKNKLSDKLKIIKGIELGQPTHNLPLAEKIASLNELDFTLCSVHELRGNEDFYFLDYDKENIDSLLTMYFDEIMETVEWNKFDSLAHLTYPLRYIVGEYGASVDLNKYRVQIDKILSALVKNGKALEINTSGLSKRLQDTMPGEGVIKRFRELGGELITIGSDSHVPENIGSGIIKGMEIAKSCGFEYVTYFERHKPVKLKF